MNYKGLAMDQSWVFLSGCALAPAVLMVVPLLVSFWRGISVPWLWRVFLSLSGASLIVSALPLGADLGRLLLPEVVAVSPLSLSMALLVQLLGTVIGSFSARYLQGEKGQRVYVAAFSGVLASVHWLLLANHWLVLIAAWACVGWALQHLLCFYPDRPFAQLAAHKKQIADRLADAFLVAAAALAWREVGSGSLADLWAYLNHHTLSPSLQLSAVALVLAVILRTALLPVHGWLIQVMEAPTPVSALLHAGVVNLGGWVLIRFAPLLQEATLARTLLIGFGLVTAMLAGMVMLTRVSIKVRLAWSTVAQMGFMLLECGLGLYTLAALHLMGHSFYKAHAFLSASMVVRQSRLQALHKPSSTLALSLVCAPVWAILAVFGLQAIFNEAPWPWWWSVVLALAWAPLLWLPAQATLVTKSLQVLYGILMLMMLTAACFLVHHLPLGIQDAPHQAFGVVAMIGMAILYGCLALLQCRSQALSHWRRWSYAGFYVDEAYTRLALKLWPSSWSSVPTSGG